MPMLRPPARRARRRSRVYKKKTAYKKKRKTYKRKRVDRGVFLKVSSGAIPLILDNNFAQYPIDPQFVQTPDTFQNDISFNIGQNTNPELPIALNDAFSNLGNPISSYKTIQLGLDEGDFTSYASLYKYMQVYKIKVQYIPAITEGNVIAIAGASGSAGAVAGVMTTDIDRDGLSKDAVGLDKYWENYPPSLPGQRKAMSRKVSRNKSIYRGWTRTFKPSQSLLKEDKYNTNTIQYVQSNPKSKYQYQPQYSLQDIATNLDGIKLGNQQFVMRMRKPQYSGFPSTSINAINVPFPPANEYVRLGTIKATAFVKFIEPYN